jgi:hypothetical protein
VRVCVCVCVEDLHWHLELVMVGPHRTRSDHLDHDHLPEGSSQGSEGKKDGERTYFERPVVPCARRSAPTPVPSNAAREPSWRSLFPLESTAGVSKRFRGNIFAPN